MVLNVSIRIVIVLGVVVMLNYLSGRHFWRWHLSPQTRTQLSSRTIGLLKSFTNNIKVTLYYDKQDRFYPAILEMLTEYHNINPRIRVTSIDPVRDVGEALKLKQAYNILTYTNRDFIIFDCEGGGRHFVPGALLVDVETKKTGEREWLKKATAFRGEIAFDQALLAITGPRPNAYFLTGHKEHLLDDTTDQVGYFKFVSLLHQNFIRTDTLSLRGTNAVPADCSLLIIAGPIDQIDASEAQKIEQYLNQGGRLFVLLGMRPKLPQSALEQVLIRWGVAVSPGEVRDPPSPGNEQGVNVIVDNFGPKPHPVVGPLVANQYSLHFLVPHPVGVPPTRERVPDAPAAQEIAFSSDKSVIVLEGVTRLPQSFPLAVAVQRDQVKGERGTTRMLVIGDSNFLGNEMMKSAGNFEFANIAINWLLDRAQLLDGVGPRRIEEYRINLTSSQARTVEWILLAALPGGVLLLGGLVWLRRRK